MGGKIGDSYLAFVGHAEVGQVEVLCVHVNYIMCVWSVRVCVSVCVCGVCACIPARWSPVQLLACDFVPPAALVASAPSTTSSAEQPIVAT